MRRLIASILVLAALVASLAAQGPFRVTSLGAFVPWGMSDAGIVVGAYPAGYGTPAIYDGVATSAIPISTSNLASNQSMVGGRAFKISPNGDWVVGTAVIRTTTPSFSETQMVWTWQRSVQSQAVLRTNLGGTNYIPSGINDSGVVAGTDTSTFPPKAYIAFGPNYSPSSLLPFGVEMAYGTGIGNGNLVSFYGLIDPPGTPGYNWYPMTYTPGGGYRTYYSLFPSGGFAQAASAAGAAGESGGEAFLLSTGSPAVRSSYGSLPRSSGQASLVVMGVTNSGLVFGRGETTGRNNTVGFIASSTFNVTDIHSVSDANDLGIQIAAISGAASNGDLVGYSLDQNNKAAVGYILTPLALGTPRVQSVALNTPNPIGGLANSLQATVTLNQAAGAGGQEVTILSTLPALTPPATVTVPEGQTSVAFNVPSSAVGASSSFSLRATLGLTRSSNGTLQPPNVVSVVYSGPGTFIGGRDAVYALRVTIGVPAPAGGLTLNASGDLALLGAPAQATAPAGATLVTVPLDPGLVAVSTPWTISFASGPSSQSLSGSLLPNTIKQIVFDRTTAVGGVDSAILTVTLNVPTKVPLVVNLVSNNPAAATGPASITIPAGASSASATITTYATSVNRDVRFTGSGPYLAARASSTLTVTP